MWSEIYEQHGATISLESWSRLIGSAGGTFDPYEDIARQTGKQVNVSSVRQYRTERVLDLIDQQPLRPGVEDYLIAAAEEGVALAIASNAGRSWVERHLDHRNLRDRFAVVLGVLDVRRPKPHPDLFVQAARGLGVRPRDAVVIEDSPHGVQAAVRAKMFCVATPHQLTTGLTMDGANIVVSSLAELPFATLRRRWQACAQGPAAGA